MLMINETTKRSDLEAAILSEPAIYATFDESRLLNGQYTDEELRSAIIGWIEDGSEVA